MKTKTFIRYLVPVIISGVLVSCSSSNKVASSFGKRKYTRGFFFDRPTKPVLPARNTASVNHPKSYNNAINTPIVTSQNTTSIVNSPVSVVEGNQVSAITHNKKVSYTKSSKEVTNSNTVISSSASSFPQATIKAASPDNSVSSASSGYGGGSCKSWILAWVLCWIVGYLGIHRFYLGYTWQGIVQLLTAGGCGIWVFIDWIRILTKSLKPKNGDYCG